MISKSLEYKKKWKNNVWSVDFGQKITFKFFQRIHACVIGGEFFILVNTKMRKEKFFKLVKSDLENKSLNYKKVKTNVWFLDVRQKNDF